MSFSSNGDALYFDGTAVAGATKIGMTANGATIDSTALLSAYKTAEIGQLDLRFQVDGVGVPVPTITQSASIEYVASGGSSGTPLGVEFFVSKRSIKAAVDGSITYLLTFCPTATAVV
jgi:hypothetical protein